MSARRAGHTSPLACGFKLAATQCQLSTHDDSDHFGLLSDDCAYGTALWLRWFGPDGTELLMLPDCPVAAPKPDSNGCCLFAGHTEQHTWEGTSEEAPCTS